MRHLGRTIVVVLMLLVHLGPAASARSGDPHMALRIYLSDAAESLGINLSGMSFDEVTLLPDRAARGLAGLFRSVTACIELSKELLSAVRVDWSDVIDKPLQAIAHRRDAMYRCASHLERWASFATATLRADERRPLSLDLWPLLRLETSGNNDLYQHDYAVLIDTGGNDTYLNNSGGNLIDVRRGPRGSSATEKAAARGCRNVGDIGNLTAPSVRTDPECVPAAAILIDTEGNDEYGRMEPPDPADDGICTNDLLVRRIMTGGAGFAGVGLLFDDDGNDFYLGKTGALGTGHVGGIGILRDGDGYDVYRAIRNSQGFGLVDGSGILEDLEGNDLYDSICHHPSIRLPISRSAVREASSTTRVCATTSCAICRARRSSGEWAR